MRRRAVVSVFASLLLLSTFSAFIISVPAQTENADHMVVATVGEPETVDPARAYDTASEALVLNVYETLIFFDREKVDEFVPRLAESYSVSLDGLTYTFVVRQGVKFHNGETLTTEDIEYSFERTMVRDFADGPSWMLYEPLLGVYEADLADPTFAQKINDAVTVTGTSIMFHLIEPYAPFLQILSKSCSSILSKSWAITQGDWPGTWTNWQDYHNPDVSPLDYPEPVMCGTGPYMLDYWEEGVEYSVVKFDSYWRGWSSPSHVSRATVKNIPDWPTRKSMFLTGDADMTDVPRVNINEVFGQPGIRCIYPLPILSLSANFFNFHIAETSPYLGVPGGLADGSLDESGIPPDFFSDLDVRKGFAQSFDYNSYLSEVYGGEAIRPATPVIEGLPYRNTDAPKYNFDLVKAEEHFKAAWGGALWTNGFTMGLGYNTGNVAGLTVCEMIKAVVENLNPKFHIDVTAREYSIYLDQLYGSELPLFILTWMADFPDPDQFLFAFMHSSGFAYLQSYSNPDVDKLIEQGLRTMDPAGRQAIYNELQQIYFEDCASSPLSQPTGRHWERDWVVGWYYNPTLPHYGCFYDTQKSLVKIPPEAKFTSSVKPDRVVEFDASASFDLDGTIAKYEWSFGDGSTGSGVTTSHTYKDYAEYTVTLKVTDNDGLTDVATATVCVKRVIKVILHPVQGMGQPPGGWSQSLVQWLQKADTVYGCSLKFENLGVTAPVPVCPMSDGTNIDQLIKDKKTNPDVIHLYGVDNVNLADGYGATWGQYRIRVRTDAKNDTLAHEFLHWFGEGSNADHNSDPNNIGCTAGGGRKVCQATTGVAQQSAARAKADQWSKKVQATEKKQGTDPADPVGDVPARFVDLSFVETWVEHDGEEWVLHFSLVVASFLNTTCELGFLIESDGSPNTGEQPEGIDYYVALNLTQKTVVFDRYDLGWTALDPTGINYTYLCEALDAIDPGIPSENIVGISLSLPLTLLGRHAGNVISVRSIGRTGALVDLAPDAGFMTILLPNIAVTDITADKTAVCQGFNMNINVTLHNQGGGSETLNLTLYGDTSPIETKTITLANETFATTTFTWNTAGYARGDYTISAYAWPAPGEIDVTDNSLMDGTVYVIISGDLNRDGTVDIYDAIILANAYNSNPESANWNAAADINSDANVDIYDAIILANNYGRTA